MTATRRLSVIAALLGAGMLLVAQPAAANIITPNTLTDEYNSDVSTCSLREAIQSANTDTAFNGCTAGSGPDEIDLGDGTYQLARADTGTGNDNGDVEITSGSVVTISHAGSGRAAIDGGDMDRVIYVNAGGTLTVSGIAIENGSVTSQTAGGIGSEGALTLVDALVTDNQILTAGYGGGIWSFSGSLTLTNVTVSNNRTPASGPGVAGIYAGGTATLTNATITNNTAGSGLGGGISLGASATVTVKNTIIAGNSAPSDPDCANVSGGTLTSQDHNLIGVSTGCPFTSQAGDQLDVPAGLSPLADNGGPTSTHALLPGSNAIDKVPAASCSPLTTDQRGYPRPSAGNANCDIGAYELTTCAGAPLNAPGAFPGCPPPPPPGSGGETGAPPATPIASPTPIPTAKKKKCKRTKKGAAAAKKCKRKK
jgi:CSLREA domain-containing protein